MALLIVVASCTGGGKTGHLQEEAALQIKDRILDTYGNQPEQALAMIDSAVGKGIMPSYYAEVLRIKVYSQAMEATRQDTAIIIGEQLLREEPIRQDLALQQDVLEVLVYSARQLGDFEMQLRYNIQLADVCRRQGAEVEALRTDAEVGLTLAQLGKTDEGLAKIDSVLRRIDRVRKFTELDASIIAMKRKISVLLENERFDDVAAVARHMLDRLADYEAHPDEYHDGFYREPKEDSRPDYIGFYRSQAWAFLVSASEGDTARHYLSLYDQTPLGKTLDGRRLIISALRRLGEYERMEAICDETEALCKERGDTLTRDFATILRDRAVAAEAQGQKDESLQLWKRYANIAHATSERLLLSQANLYAARYHVQEQQQEIAQQKSSKRYIIVVALFVSLLALAGLFFAWYAARQWRKTQLKNRALAQQIKEAYIYKEKYEALADSSAAQPGAASPPEQSPQPKIVSLDGLSPEELFHYIEHEVSRRLLFLNPAFDRQMIIDEFHISKERVGAAFSQGSKYDSLPQFVSDLRLEYASKLLVTTDLPISEITSKAGFSNASVFSRCFSRKFQISPTQYRRFHIDKLTS